MNNQYTLAWENLLKLIIFKQRKEALCMAKLLGHVMGDKILSQQLLGDIYLFLSEFEQAKEQYEKVFDEYKRMDLRRQSIGIYKHLQLLSFVWLK